MPSEQLTQPIIASADKDSPAGNSLFLNVALGCGVTPLVVGAALIVIYSKTYAAWIPDAELALLICAPGFFLAGGACLSLANRRRMRPRSGAAADRFESRFWRRVVLLLVNIPAIIAGAYVFSMLENRTVIGIENASGEVLDVCDIVAIDSVSRKADSHPRVPVNGQIRSEFNLDEEATIHVTILQRGVKVDFDVSTGNRDGVKQRVRIASGLTHEVTPW